MEKAVIFGCGQSAREYGGLIREQFEVIAYSCNRPEKWGQELNGLTILEPARIPEDAAIVVASDRYYPEIIYGLEQQGRSENIYTVIHGHIIRYFPSAAREGQWAFEFPQLEAVPSELQADISGLCNSKCQYCPFHSEFANYPYPLQLMDEKVLDRIILQAHDIKTFKTLTFVGNGEPMTHPRWNEYATRILQECGSIKEFVMYTNGMLLTRENVEKLSRLPARKIRLFISIDGISPEDCEYWRKGEKFPVIQENVNEAWEILGCQANLDVEFVVRGSVVLPHFVDVSSPAAVKSFLEESQQWRKEMFPFAAHANVFAYPYANQIPGTKTVAASMFPYATTCFNLFSLVPIAANGDILSCPCGPMTKNETGYIVGNIMEDDLLHVFYHNQDLLQMRNDLLNNRRPRQCGSCAGIGASKQLCLQRTE